MATDAAKKTAEMGTGVLAKGSDNLEACSESDIYVWKIIYSNRIESNYLCNNCAI